MGVLGYTDFFPRANGSWPSGMPVSVLLVQNNPWAGYGLLDAINRINLIPSNLPLYIRYAYSSTSSTPRNGPELNDASGFLQHILNPSNFPQFQRAKGWLICNEPNLEGGGLPASNVAVTANRLASVIKQNGHRCGTPPIAPFHDTNGDLFNDWWDHTLEHPLRVGAHPSENYLWQLLTRLDYTKFGFYTLHTYANDIGAGAEEPFRDPRDLAYDYPWGTNVASAQVAIIRECIRHFPGQIIPLPTIIDEFNTGGHEQSPAQNYHAGWLQNALRYVDAAVGNLGMDLEAFLWFTGRSNSSWAGFCLENPQGKMSVCRAEYDNLVDAGV